MTRAGTWLWGGRYRPYGVQAESRGTSPGQPYSWTGREYDPETGFYFLRARYYDPTVGRFTQEDPIGSAGGSNLYAYVSGQPLEARDPSGLGPDPIGGGARFQAYLNSIFDPCPAECGSRNGWDGWYGFMDSRSLLPLYSQQVLDEWEAYKRAFAAAREAGRDSDQWLTANNGARPVILGSVAEFWETTEALGKDAFARLWFYTFNQSSGELTIDQARQRLRDGKVGIGNSGVRWLARASRRAESSFYGATFKGLTQLPDRVFGHARARTAWVHENLHAYYPNWGETTVCRVANRLTNYGNWSCI